MKPARSTSSSGRGLIETWRDALLRSQLLAVQGLWQCATGPVPPSGCGQGVAPGVPAVRHLVAQRFKDLTPLLGRLGGALHGSRDFH